MKWKISIQSNASLSQQLGLIDPIVARDIFLYQFGFGMPYKILK